MNELYVFTYTDLAILSVVMGTFGFLLGGIAGLLVGVFSKRNRK